MNRSSRFLMVAAVAMIVAAGLAHSMKPTKRVAEGMASFDLDAVVPKRFGEWRVDIAVPVAIVNPQQQEVLDRIYGQTLARTYVNPRGQRVMLSMAYGGDQSDSMQVHKPEVCYPAQGFVLWSAVAGDLVTQYGKLPVKRLVTSLGQRREPVTYWVTVGDRAVKGGIQQKIAQLGYGLTGRIPDGMLVRVSSIDSVDARAFELQEEFLGELLSAMSPDVRARVAGRFGD